jgi:hypothetical protein
MMMDRSDNDGTRRPGTRPFVSGRPVAQVAPLTFAYLPSRPFSFAGERTSTTAGTRTTTSSASTTSGAAPTPLWTVAVYEPGLEHVAQPESEAPALLESQPRRSKQDDVVEASLALAEDVIEAGRHASSIAAAEVLEVVAHRLRRGEILLLPGASTQTDAAVVSSVLAALLGGRR